MKLTQLNTSSLSLSGRILLSSMLNISQVELLSYRTVDVTEEVIENLNKLNKGVPLDYVLGGVEVNGVRLHLNTHTLIPREETEYLIKIFLSSSNAKHTTHVVDLGTGSGLIACSLASKGYMNISASDISNECLSAVSTSIIDNKFTSISLFESNWLKNNELQTLCSEESILVCNPPYVPDSDISHALKNNVNHEPQRAIYSGPDGLGAFCEIISQMLSYSISFKEMWFELDPRNIRSAQKILKDVLKRDGEIVQDQMKNERYLVVL